MSNTRQIPGPDHPLVPVVRAYTRYFTPTVTGIDHVPTAGPALIVGNHSSIFWAPEVWIAYLALLDRRRDEPTFALAHEILLRTPLLGDALRSLGIIPAAPESATSGLKDGGAVMVYPGGDWEACRPWTQRGRIDFAGRRGFVRLALATGVPVIPVVADGGHDSIFILSRGDRTARMLRLDKLVRAKVFPYTVGFPFGVAPIVPQVPLPARVHVSFLPALDWSAGPGDPDDPAFVDACYRQTVDTLQSELDRLRTVNVNPIGAGIRAHLKGLPGPLSGLASLL